MFLWQPVGKAYQNVSEYEKHVSTRVVAQVLEAPARVRSWDVILQQQQPKVALLFLKIGLRAGY